MAAAAKNAVSCCCCCCCCCLLLLLLLLAAAAVSPPAEASPAPHTDFSSYYHLLKLKKEATETEIKRAYRRLSLELHPDKVKAKNGDPKAAEELFQKINQAYQVLSNSKSRRLFDTYGPLYEAHEEYYNQLERQRMQELYLYKKGVHLIFPNNLDALLRNSPYTWIVSFYQAGCGSCERRVPFFVRLGELTLETVDVRLGMVNCEFSHLCNFFGIRRLGQILIFPPKQEGGDSWDPQEYEGSLNAAEILSAARRLKTVNLEETLSDAFVKEELKKIPTTAAAAKGGVVAAWIVDYYRPSCPPCRQLRSELKRLSRSLSQQIRITLVNCERGRCDVPHYPYLRLFVKHSNGLIRAHTLPYGTADHPAANAIQLAAFVFNSVLGLDPPSLQETEKEKRDSTKDEL